MKTMNCNIIQDLIPLYVDGICSDASKECVEEHITECNQCKSLIDIYQNTEISDPNIEQKQIDSLKKFHGQMKLKNMFSVILVLLLIGLGSYTFCTNYISPSTILYYILFPVCMIGLYFGDKENMKGAEKIDYIVAILSIVNTILGIAFMFYSLNRAISGKKVFSIESSQLGPFINKVWGILFLLLVIGFVYLLLRMIRNKIYNKSMICLQMMGMFLFLAYVTLLRRLDSVEYFYRFFTQITVIIGVMGLVGSVGFAVIGHKSKKPTV